MNREPIKIRMRDGINLETIVFSSIDKNSQKLPIILLRTPYMYKDGVFREDRFGKEAEYYVRRGYHFVLQSIRGTHGSDGKFLMFNPLEISDAKDTLDWLMSQPFSKDSIAAVGSSYEGFTALAAGITNHPSLKVIFSSSAPASLYEDYFIQNGVINLSTLDYLRYVQTKQGWVNTKDFNKILVDKCKDNPDISTYDKVVFDMTIPEWQIITKNLPDPKAEIWKERQIVSQLKNIQVPTYHMAGLHFDGNSPDTVRNFMEIERNSKNKTLNHLFLGYWNHGESIPHGDGSNVKNNIQKYYDGLLEYYLNNSEMPTLFPQRVNVQSNHENTFLQGNFYPLPEWKDLKLFLAHDGMKGNLARTAPLVDYEASYTFIPKEKNMFDGKQHLEYEWSIDSRISLIGNVMIDVFFKINVPQTELMFFMYKKDKAGKQDYYGCRAASKVMLPSSGVGHIQLATCPMLDTLNPGEILGFEITSNNFPTRARNTGQEIESFYSSFKDIQVSILHSSKYPSSITFKTEE